MIIPETDIEPMLIDFFSDDSVIGDSSDTGIDALWWEVGELLEGDVPVELDCMSEKPPTLVNEKKRAKAIDTSVSQSNKRRKATEDDMKREIRMARNRASAERTRLRRLEHVKSLETEAAELDAANESLQNLLVSNFGKSGVELADDVCSQVTADVPEPPRRSRNKKGDAKDVIKMLECDSDNLSPDEIAKLRKEARMARNRASAERTRLRRLEAARQLEVRVAGGEVRLQKLLDMVQELSESLTQEQRDSLEIDKYLDMRNRFDSAAKPCSGYEVTRLDSSCETRPVPGDLQEVS